MQYIKQCLRCHQNKPLDQFDSQFSKVCNPCRPLMLAARQVLRRNHQRTYHLNHRDELITKQRVRNRKNSHRLTFEQFNMMLDKQEHKCPICNSELDYSCHVDHDHKTDKVRELLCGPCNRGLGQFRDNPEIMLKGAEYLRKHSS